MKATQDDLQVKYEDHEEQIQLLNQAYVTTHNEFHHATKNLQQTNRTIIGRIEGIKIEQSMNADLMQSQVDAKSAIETHRCNSDHKAKFKEIQA